MATTIKDIAQKAGVSIATVSRAINGGGGSSKETRERILKIAGRLNYCPNLQARGLVARRPDAIGIVITQASVFTFANPYFTEILKGIAAKTNETNQYMVLSISRKEHCGRMFQHHLVAGLIVLANRINDPEIIEARKQRIPMVLTPGDPENRDIPSVDVDHGGGIRQAVDHLWKLGHREIFLLCGPMNAKYSRERSSAFRLAMQEKHQPFADDSIGTYDFTPEDAYRKVRELLGNPHPPTAILLMNDLSAVGVLRAAKEGGRRVPQELSIVGFGDGPMASLTNPPLTTIREPFQEIGIRAADMLAKIVRGKRVPTKHVVLPVRLVIRESTAPSSRSYSNDRGHVIWKRVSHPSQAEGTV